MEGPSILILRSRPGLPCRYTGLCSHVLDNCRVQNTGTAYTNLPRWIPLTGLHCAAPHTLLLLLKQLHKPKQDILSQADPEPDTLARQAGWQMSRNQDLNPLHVSDAAEFLSSVDWRVVSGDTLVFDFIYFLHPARSFQQCIRQLA